MTMAVTSNSERLLMTNSSSLWWFDVLADIPEVATKIQKGSLQSNWQGSVDRIPHDGRYVMLRRDKLGKPSRAEAKIGWVS